MWRIISGFFSGWEILPLGPLAEELAQLFPLLLLLHLLLQLLHPALECCLLRVRRGLGSAGGLVLQRRQERLQGPLFPLVILLARDAQRLRRFRGRQLAGADFEDHLRPLSGFGIHLLRFCRSQGWVGNLVVDLFQPAGKAGGRDRPLPVLEQGLQARAQGFALAQVDPALQRLEHALHRPLLPLVEGDPIDVQLAADFRWLAAFRPHRQHRLDFVRGTVRWRWDFLFPFRIFRGVLGGGHR